MHLETQNTSLWEQVFDVLPDNDKQGLRITKTDTDPQPQEILQVVEKKNRECVRKQWVLYTNKAVTKVLFRG